MIRMFHCAAVVDRPVNGLDDVARLPRAVGAHGLEADDVRVRRDVADGAGDVRAVAVLVAAAQGRPRR